MTCAGTGSCNQGRNQNRCDCGRLVTENSDGSSPDMPVVMFDKPKHWLWTSLRDAVALAALAGLLGIVAGMIFGGLK